MDLKDLPESDLLLALIEQSETVFNIKDLDGKYLFANNQTRQYFPDPEADYLGKTDFDFFPTEIASRFREADLKVINTKEKIILEEKVNVASAVATHLSVKFPIFSNNNNIIATGMFTTDITKRKHQEQHQLSILEKYQNLITAFGEITYDYDALNNTFHWGGNYEDVLGYHTDEIGQNESDWLSLIHPEDMDAVLQEYTRAQQENHIFDLEYRLRAKDGSYLWFHDRGVMSVDENNNMVFITGLLRHITEQKEQKEHHNQLQKQILQMQKIDALGQLTGGIAHDFNNILSSIRGYTELTLSQVSKPDNVSTLERYLKEVLIASDRAAQLVQQMLSFSRGKTGTPELITPETGIHEVIRLLHAMIPSSISIEFELKHHGRHIKIDPVNLQQVLINLILNSRDAIQEQSGKIKIVLDEKPVSKLICASCHEHIRQKMISISVKDNGDGIDSEEILNRMFDPFFTTKVGSKGSGLGLSVVHGIMHSCGGHILVKENPGKGACVELLFLESFELPDTEEDIPPPQSINHRSKARGNDSSYIMIIDDELAITAYLSELLKQHSFQVISFNDPTKALDAFKASPETCSLIITDQTMPELTGDKLAEKILEIRPDMPIIMCSGYSEMIDKVKAKAIGISAYMDKPIDKDSLLKNIYGLLRNTSKPSC